MSLPLSPADLGIDRINQTMIDATVYRINDGLKTLVESGHTRKFRVDAGPIICTGLELAVVKSSFENVGWEVDMLDLNGDLIVSLEYVFAQMLKIKDRTPDEIRELFTEDD